jgi:hypothetical protein
VYRLFLDANVLFTAAHNPEGKAAFLSDASGHGSWGLLASACAIEEARRNIVAKYPHCEARLNTGWASRSAVAVVAITVSNGSALAPRSYEHLAL